MGYARIMTAYAECAADMLEIENIRKTVKQINKSNKRAEMRHNYNPMTDDLVTFPQYYVKLAGRYGRNNPKYNSTKANQGCVPLADAERYDVYIYQR